MLPTDACYMLLHAACHRHSHSHRHCHHHSYRVLLLLHAATAATCYLLLHVACSCMLHAACMLLLLLHAAAIAHAAIAHRHCPMPPPTATAHRQCPPPSPTDIAHHLRLIIVDSGSGLLTGTFRGFLLWKCPRPLNSQRNKNSQREGKPSSQARCHPSIAETAETAHCPPSPSTTISHHHHTQQIRYTFH